VDLFAVAAANAPALQNQFNGLLSGSSAADADCLKRFADRVREDGRISINMRQTVLNSFLCFGQHQNIYEWAQSQGRCTPYSQALPGDD
jgi:hypothetical protein